MKLTTLLADKGLDTTKNRVLVMRHVPHEAHIKKVLPWLAAEHPELFAAYQKSQHPTVEKQLINADFLASFIGAHSEEALFVGVYKTGPVKTISSDQYWKIPENQELRRLGMTGIREGRTHVQWVKLVELEEFVPWKGKLIITWPPGRAWSRWAQNGHFELKALLEKSALTKDIQNWDELVLTWEELKTIPRDWIKTLSQLPCIYLILDGADGKGYVGSAYGQYNLYQRWRYYGASGDGGNKLLKGRNPDKFLFSILEVLPSNMTEDDVFKRESNWKKRLHTREFGLNAN